MTPVSSSGDDLRDAAAPVPLTLDRLRQERLLRNSEVLAGCGRLDVALEWCRTAADVLADAGPLDGVVVIGDEEELTADGVQALAARGVAAVLVRNWTRERWAEHPPAGDLPVVGVPEQTRPDSVARHVARLNLAYESHILRYAQTIHTALASLLHRGAGVDALCSRLARLSSCAVALVSPNLDLLAFAEGPEDWLDPSTVGSLCRETIRNLGEEGIRALEHREAIDVRAAVKHRECTCIVTPIDLANRLDGWLLLVDGSVPALEHDIAEQKVAVQQASTIIGTELLRMHDIERAEERARGNFVHALLHGRFSNHADLVARSEHHDFPLEERFGVVVVQASGLIGDDDSPHRLAFMAREASRLQRGEGQRTMSAVVGDVIGVVRQVDGAGVAATDGGSRELAAFAAALAKRLQAQTDRKVLVAYGRPVLGAGEIAKSYREARIALALSEQLHLPAPAGFGSLRVYSTLLDLAQQEAGRSFAREMLAPLRRGSSNLEDAVRAYVDAGGNLNQAARDLSVHRNTMLYKIERASRALGQDLRTSEARFAVSLALKLDRLSQTADEVRKDIDAG